MATSTEKSAVKPTRSPIERGIVWGVIAIGLIVVGIEGASHLRYGAVLGALQSRLKEFENTDGALTKKDVDAIVGNLTPESRKLEPGEVSSTAHRVDEYSYPGLMRTRKIYVYYGIAGQIRQDKGVDKDGKKIAQVIIEGEPEVLDISSSPVESAAEALAKLPPPSAESANAPGTDGPRAPGMMSAGGPGGPGGPGPSGKSKKRPDAEGEEKPAEEKPAAEAPGAEKTDETKPEAEKAEEKPKEEAKPAA